MNWRSPQSNCSTGQTVTLLRFNHVYRISHVYVKDIAHLFSSCPNVSSLDCLPVANDFVAKTIYNVIRQKKKKTVLK